MRVSQQTVNREIFAENVEASEIEIMQPGTQKILICNNLMPKSSRIDALALQRPLQCALQDLTVAVRDVHVVRRHSCQVFLHTFDQMMIDGRFAKDKGGIASNEEDEVGEVCDSCWIVAHKLRNDAGTFTQRACLLLRGDIFF